MNNYIEKLNRRQLHNFNNYIEQIRFPFFKKITRNQVINFNFPFTALVGPNGSGKSSVLQALYGACLGKSVSDFWFSTRIDPIRGTGNEINRFIYKFKPDGYKNAVEVLNQRTTAKKRSDPDYWETQSPTKKDNMEPMPSFHKSQEKFRSKTRWNPINKDVTYIDFRSELSAFDKCFYFGHFKKTKSIKNIKDFLRARSRSLKKMLDKGISPSQWNSKNVNDIYQLHNDALSWSNKILGKKYIEAQIVEHDLFNQKGISIIFKTDHNQYSEAVAGSGEVAVITAVLKILKAEPHSLILLDEPEVSLHPGAQLQLRELLLYKTYEENCQVVISTHSQTFLKQLPNKAIKLFYLDEANESYSVAEEASPEQAFFRLGGLNEDKSKMLYVEDDLAKLLIEEAIKEIDTEYFDDLQIIPHPGGAEEIIKNLTVNFALSNASKKSNIVLLDGDKNRNVDKIRSTDIAEKEKKEIDNILKTQTGIHGSNFDLHESGGNVKPETKEKNKIDFLLKVLDAYHDYFYFMNVDTPEELIWNIANDNPKMKGLCSSITGTNYKNNFKSLAESISPEVNSKTIFNAQIMMLTNRDKNHTSWITFKNKLKDILKINTI